MTTIPSLANLIHRYRVTAFATLLTVLFNSGAEATIVFTDGEFSPANWTYENYFWGSNSTTHSQDLVGGNQGALLHTNQTTGGNGTLNWLVCLNTTFVFNPATDGRLAAVDFAIDGKVFYAQYGSSANFIVVAEQGGQLFGMQEAAHDAVDGAPWQRVSVPNLTVDSWFKQYVAVSGSPTKAPYPRLFTGPVLDVSETGGPITFGFISDSGATFGGQRVEMGYDNIEITARTVPEPTSILLFLLGSSLAATRRKRA